MNFKISIYSVVFHLFPVMLGIVIAFIVFYIRRIGMNFSTELILLLMIVLLVILLPYFYFLFNHICFSKGKSFTIEGEFHFFLYSYQGKVYKFNINDISSVSIVGCFTRGLFTPGLIFKYVKIKTNNGNQIIITSLMMPQLEDVFIGETVRVTAHFPYLSDKDIIIIS